MLSELAYARDYAVRKNLWVVVVVPPESHTEAQNAIVAVANGHPFGGRTMSLGGEAKVSLVRAGDTLFVPAGQFEVMFVGWGGVTTQAGELGRWQKASRGAVNRTM